MSDEEALAFSGLTSGAGPVAVSHVPRPPLNSRARDVSLLFESGGLRGQRYDFAGRQRVVLGREKHSDVEVHDPRVSRRHCSITIDAEKATVKDLGSTHGTLLNGVPVGLALISDGDILTLGDTHLRVAFGSREGTVKLARARCDLTTESGRMLHRPAPRIDVPGYELLGVLGEGATSAVFKARDAGGKLVAVKVFRGVSNDEPDERERFLREARTAAALDHPNIVRVLGHGETDQGIYIVMELVRGETMRARLGRTGALPVTLALHIARQIASALDYARLMQTVHRDVKPENIILTDGNVAKLVDFGLAKSVVLAGTSGVTRAGDVLGTLAYMSPEQLTSSVTADHRADIYSLGATLYHMLAGRTPFDASTNMDYMRKIAGEEPPDLRLHRPGVPVVVSALVSRCLRKRPDERYPTAGEIVRIISGFLASAGDRSTVS